MVLLTLLHLASFCQSHIEPDKEFRISSGAGFGSATENVSSIGTDWWIQFDYKLATHFSIAMESDFAHYKQHGLYADLPVKPNEMKVYDNNFSLLVKYHFSPLKRIKIDLASGWTYCIRQTEYYNLFAIDTLQVWTQNITSFSDYRIPFVAEVAYSVMHNVDIIARIKYNLNTPDGDTYSASIGLSLKL